MSKKPNNESNDDQKMSLDKRMYAFFKNPEGDSEAATICKEKAEAGDYNAMLWLARMYRDGNGVVKNLTKSAKLMREAANHNVDQAKNELLDILWCANTTESLKEMISTALLQWGSSEKHIVTEEAWRETSIRQSNGCEWLPIKM